MIHDKPLGRSFDQFNMPPPNLAIVGSSKGATFRNKDLSKMLVASQYSVSILYHFTLTVGVRDVNISVRYHPFIFVVIKLVSSRKCYNTHAYFLKTKALYIWI